MADAVDPYAHLELKKYQFWTLQLYQDDQRFLGRAIATMVRHKPKCLLIDLTVEEREELFTVVMHEYQEALKRLWGVDYMNYMWKGNDFASHEGHGHMHLVPR